MKKSFVKKIISTFLSMAMVLTLLPIDISAESVFDGGDGTKDNPYKISTADQLVFLGETEEDSYLSAYYKLENDIDLNGKTMSPIGVPSSYSISKYFTGGFDGDNHTIKNMTLSGKKYQALFNSVKKTSDENGYVKNLKMDTISVKGTQDVGSIVAYNYGGIIENCKVSNAKIVGVKEVGGLIGKNYYSGNYIGKIDKSSFEGNVSKDTTSTSSSSDFGGLIGYNNAKGTEDVTISESYAKADINAASNYVGGIAGEIYASKVENSYFIGSVSGNNYVGGVSGNIRSSYSGGAYAKNIYTVSTVTGNTAGSLFGEYRLSKGSIENINFDSEVSQNSNIYGSKDSDAIEIPESVSGKTTDEMKKTIYNSTLWRLANDGENKGYPCLVAFGKGSGEDPKPPVEEKEQLESPQSVKLDKAIATWDAVENATGYKLQLYKDNSKSGQAVEVGNVTEYDITELLEFYQSGEYAVTITAIGGENYKDSKESEKSNTYKFVSENDFISISTADQLVELTTITSTDEQKQAWAKNYKLTADIDLTEKTTEKLMKSIGNSTVEFTGIFDGNGHTISNFALKSANSGLFYSIGKDATVKNLGLVSPVVDAASGSIGILAKTNKGTIENCYIKDGKLVSKTGGSLGGLVYQNDYDGTISKSYVSGGLVSTEYNYATSIGGLAATNRGQISECYATAELKASPAKWVGGLVGWLYSGEITDCYTMGSVNAKELSGGFVGRMNSETKITNCYSLNNVSVTTDGNAFVGEMRDGGGTITNSYYNSEMRLPKSTSEVSGVVAKDNDALKVVDLGSKWTKKEDVNSGYPYLKNLSDPTDLVPAKLITVQVMLANYDEDKYEFSKRKGPIDVEVQTVNPTVEDVLVASKDEIPYKWTYTKEYGYFVESLDGINISAPSGWMFTINDVLAQFGVSSQTVKDGDKILWYPGMPSNLFEGPKWDEINGTAKPDEGKDAEEFEGKGTKESPYLIKNAALLSKVMQHPDAYFKVTEDIDMKGVDFEPIGTEETPFTGVFDGDNHTISNLTIQKDANSKNIGLFGVLSKAKVINLNIKDAKISGGSNLGILAGYAKEYTKSNEESYACLIGNCHVSGEVKVVKDSTSSYSANVGGLLGLNDGNNKNEATDEQSYKYSSVDKCSADVNVVSKYKGSSIGGLVGYNRGIITESYAIGNVSGEGLVGGLVGSNWQEVYNSYSTGNVTGKNSVGGFVGLSQAKIKDCFSTGNVVCLTGGQNAGGFAGSIQQAKTQNCVSSGYVISPMINNKGSFVGNFSGTLNTAGNVYIATLVDCYGNNEGISCDNLKGIGSYISSGNEESDKAAKEVAVDYKTSQEKINKMAKDLGITTIEQNDKAKDKEEVLKEAQKYEDTVSISTQTNINEKVDNQIIKLKDGNSASEDISIFKTQNEFNGYILYRYDTASYEYIKENNDKETKSEKVSLIFVKNGEYIVKDIDVKVPSSNLVNITFDAGDNSEKVVKSVSKDEKLDYTPDVPLKEGYTFVGWYKDADDITTEYKTGLTYTEDVTYKAKYAHVTMLGAQGKLVADGKSGIRFGTKIYNDGDEIIEKGTLILPTSFLEEGQGLTLDTPKVAKSVGKVNYEVNKDENYVTYLGTIINIPEAQFHRQMTAASYVIYKDKTGNTYTVYSQYPNGSTSVYDLLGNNVDWNEKW